MIFGRWSGLGFVMVGDRPSLCRPVPFNSLFFLFRGGGDRENHCRRGHVHIAAKRRCGGSLYDEFCPFFHTRPSPLPNSNDRHHLTIYKLRNANRNRQFLRARGLYLIRPSHPPTWIFTTGEREARPTDLLGCCPSGRRTSPPHFLMHTR